MPTAKKEYYAAQNSIDSIKQYIMMYEYKPEHWSKEYIADHNEKMISLLMRQFETSLEIQIFGESIYESENLELKIDKPNAIKWFEDFQKTNTVLLARSLMCFGRIDFEIGWTSGGEKWNFYQWEKIKETEAFTKYTEYVSANNPETLEQIIDSQLKNNEELREDSYRYVFVSRPEIMEYCSEGNFGWINDGKKIILMEGSRASIYNSCDLYTFILSKHIKSKYNIPSYCGNDRLKITFTENDGSLEIAPIDWDEEVLFEIWNNGIGQLCYEINTRDLHGNTKVIRNLKDSGWDYNEMGRFYYVKKPVLIEISDDIDSNILKSLKEFDALVKFLK